MSTRKTRSLALAAVLLSAMLLSACGLFGPSPDATPLPSPLLTPSAPPAATPSDPPTPAPSAEPELISSLEEASALVCEAKNQPQGSHQYTALDFALAEDEDGFVQAAVLFRDAGALSEGNIFVITQNSSTVITYGGPDDIYRYTDRCSLEIRGGDTVSYYVENYDTGELVLFAFRCSELEDGTPHYETVDGPQ